MLPILRDLIVNVFQFPFDPSASLKCRLGRIAVFAAAKKE
jgi:hypothetical protein